jgi:hypothetical protein
MGCGDNEDRLTTEKIGNRIYLSVSNYRNRMMAICSDGFLYSRMQEQLCNGETPLNKYPTNGF